MPRIFRILFLFASFPLGAQVNMDFELTSPGAYTASNSVTGWTLSSQTRSFACTTPTWAPGSNEFSIVSTPYSVPAPFSSVLGTLGPSPLGGNNVARLNGVWGNSSVTKLSKTFTITSSNSLLKFAVAGAGEKCVSQCCHNPFFHVEIKDPSGIPPFCTNFKLLPNQCELTAITSTMNPLTNIFWTDWQVRPMDLSFWTGQVVTLELMCGDCVAGSHNGLFFVDIAFEPQPDIFYYCPGASQYVIHGPKGYSLNSWMASSSPSWTTSVMKDTLVVTNPVGITTYTMAGFASIGDFCPPSTTRTFTLAPLQSSIASVAANPSCFGGASGSATVSAAGLFVNYLYSWVSPGNSVVSTSAIAANLSPGPYTVTATGTSAGLSCNSASTTVLITSAAQNTSTVIKPVCNLSTTVCAPGSSVQWYAGSNLIAPANGGTTSCYGVPNPATGIILSAGYINPAGCRDSIIYTLNSASAGTLSLSNPNVTCPGASNGSVVVTFTPSPDAGSILNTFSITATGSTPGYTSGISANSVSSYTATGLQEGTYSITTSDGLCSYSKSLAVTAHHFDYTVSIPQSTLCEGSVHQAVVSYSTPVSQFYSYSWSPANFLFNPTTNPVTILPSVVPPATAAVVAYSVTVTHPSSKCAITKTLAVTMLHPATPVISAIPSLCDHPNSTHTISVNAAGGTFSGNFTYTPVGGVLQGSQIPPGKYTLIYTSTAVCVPTASASFTVNPAPKILVSGTTELCAGETTTLFATGASSYSWNALPGSASQAFTPTASVIYMVSGIDPQTSCPGQTPVTVNVQPLPSLSISGNTMYCVGESTTLTASGAYTYTWNNGPSGASIMINTFASTVYTLQGTSTPIPCTSSQTVAITVSPCTGIEELANVDQLLSIYPNPATHRVFIESAEDILLSVSDGTGKIIVQEKFIPGRHELDLTGFANSLYFIHAKGKSGTKVMKLIKND